MPSSKPRRRFEDIIQNVDAALRYTAGMTAGQFVADDKTVDAVERCLTRISEAASKLADQAEALAPGEEWGKIRGLGNLLRHEYDMIERPVLWDIVEHNLVPLRRACMRSIELIDQGFDRDPDAQPPG